MSLKTVWVIGASGGLGLATANAFAESGWRVVAGARAFRADEPGPGERVIRRHLDATDAASCSAFARDALRAFGRVDALVYAAGLLVLGPCEETSAEEYERVMRTNFIGMTRMVALALPAMRAQGEGRIVLFSSLNGLMGIPFQSAYVASKHAIEGYAECLAMELRPFHIQVCVVEPGDHAGGSQHTRLRAEGASAASPYATLYERACAVIRRDEAGGLSPEALGRKVARNAERRRMRFRLRVAKPDQRLAVVLHDALPPCASFRILRGYYAKKGAGER